MDRILIKNGRVIDPLSGIDETLDVLIADGRIAEVKVKVEGEHPRTIDASRLVVCPGFIDMHVHLREPGFEAKETIDSGARAAAKGGFTSICCMPNTRPVNDNRVTTEFILARARKKSRVNIFPVAAVTKGLRGEELTDMAALIGAGAVAFTDDGQPVSSSLIMCRALSAANSLATLVIDHCEDKGLSEGGILHEGRTSSLLGLKGIPSVSEELMVARDAILAESLSARVHIAHVSVKGSIRELRAAKERGVRITAEATPHHLVLNDAALVTADANLKVNPPLRAEEDRLSLVEAVRSGVIDVFATDHAPHTIEDKARGLREAPFGINGLETAVSLLLDRLVAKGVLSLSRFVEMSSTAPARILGLDRKGSLRTGSDADLTILNLRREWIVDTGSFQSLSRNSPFHGWKLRGAPVMTIVGGRIAYPFDESEAEVTAA